MSNVVIKADKLSKRYRIGLKEQRYDSLSGMLSFWIRSPWSNFRRLRKLSVFDDVNSNSEDVIWALREVSFEVMQGEVLGVIGRNGAGKSTLLKILSRITELTAGSVKIQGRVSSLLEVGTGFHPELTGRENVYLNGTILGMTKRKVRNQFDEIVEFSGVEKFIDTPIKRYSSGMRVRLAFAVAAHLEPEILLIDEVLAVGDIEFQKKCLRKMDEVAHQGRTVLLVSHNMASISNLCQRVIMLDKGVIVKQGDVQDVVQTYISSSAATKGEMIWKNPEEAPGDHSVRLHAVRILQEGIIQGATADVNISKAVTIEILFWVLKETVPLYSGIWLRDGAGIRVLCSTNAPSMNLRDDKLYGTKLSEGLYRSVCVLPSDFLNDGLYHVTIIVNQLPVGGEVKGIFEDELVSFYVHDTGAMRDDFTGNWGGVVRPRLEWSTRIV